jgi:hypothetical protein
MRDIENRSSGGREESVTCSRQGQAFGVESSGEIRVANAAIGSLTPLFKSGMGRDGLAVLLQPLECKFMWILGIHDADRENRILTDSKLTIAKRL